MRMIHHVLKNLVEISGGRIQSTRLHQFAETIEDLAFDRCLNKSETARLLGVSLRTIDTYVRFWGLKKHFREGPDGRTQRTPFFRLSDVLEFQARHQSPAEKQE